MFRLQISQRITVILAIKKCRESDLVSVRRNLTAVTTGAMPGCSSTFLRSLNVCIQRCLNRGHGRIDDNEETLKNRIAQFKVEGLPVIDYYGARGLVTRIDGSRTPEQVFQQVQHCLDRIIHNQ
uniref:UMP/CMP kinase n=1 Tax=Mesocestoides corti TaxID=53468 RepID=A0A5K3FYS6_MESCO